MHVALALVTCPPDRADALATALVEAGVAACVNIVPQIRSVYRWDGKLCRDDEALLLIKHRADRFDALREAVLARHPYELPEIIAVDLDRGHAPYLDWVLRATS
ncbi:divalent-cation tolerance protein CutA [Sinimarinibacterium thermocellulolyticum]|uniref:Divalent-cation tolerance protein CutA n=1 Tax=Sinimarinibacterium thermocellulolyticum TaxID=3170016 RepID=A0ABV2A9Y9_9GAMM